MSQYSLADSAKSDLHEIWLYISDDNPRAADRLIDALLAKCGVLADHPTIGRPRDDLGPSLRSVSRGNYTIIYQPAPDGVRIFRIFSGFRDIEAEFEAEA